MWIPIKPRGGGPQRGKRGDIFIRRRGRIIAVSAEAYRALGLADYIQVLRDGPRVRIEPCDRRDPNSRRLAPVGKSAAAASFACAGMPIPDRQRITCHVVDGGLETV